MLYLMDGSDHSLAANGIVLDRQCIDFPFTLWKDTSNQCQTKSFILRHVAPTTLKPIIMMLETVQHNAVKHDIRNTLYYKNMNAGYLIGILLLLT